MSEQPAGMTSPSAAPEREGLEEAREGAARAKAPQPLSRYARASVVRPKGAGPGAQPSLIHVEQVETSADEQSEAVDQAATRKYSPIEPGNAVEQMGLPAEPVAEPERIPFWKRIALPRAQPASKSPHSTPPMDLDPILERIKQLEAAMTTHQAATLGRLDSFEQNITRLWELEEQMALTEVRERLALLEANQEEIADGLHSVARNLSILAVVLALGVAAASLGIGFLI